MTYVIAMVLMCNNNNKKKVEAEAATDGPPSNCVANHGHGGTGMTLGFGHVLFPDSGQTLGVFSAMGNTNESLLDMYPQVGERK